MGRSWWTKFLFLLTVVAGSVVYVLPTVLNLDLQTTKFPFKQKVNLGLDLQGGLYIVLGADFNKVFKDVVERQGSNLKERLNEKSISIKGVDLVTDGQPADDPKVKVTFDADKREAVYGLIKQEYTALRLTDEKPGELWLGVSGEYRGEIREKTINQSIEVIRNRIDEFGVAEPSIASQGRDRLVVELPGVRDVERAKSLIGRTARLEFKMVDDKALPPAQVMQMVSEAEKAGITYKEKEGQKFGDYLDKVNTFAKAKLPEGTEIAFERVKSFTQVQGQEGAALIPYLLKKKVEIGGEDLQDAQIGFDQESQRPDVNFTMNPKGASKMERLTGENIGKRMAIVLDGVVQSAPVINGRISSRGRITLGQGNADTVMRDAKDLAIVLRAGALPAQLEFLEQRVVGPSLGQDSIKKGAMASLIGSLLVFLFVAVYYRVSGLIAVFSLVLNVIFVLACLVGLEATLTLPGIAGIALTVGIAVDSNVVIYERIREEIRAGKRLFGAVDSGFQKAFRTILDANVTNAAAAGVLLLYGTGPIKGFAVTLLIGIVTTLFTAVFVCKVVFDGYLKILEKRGAEKLSI